MLDNADKTKELVFCFIIYSIMGMKGGVRRSEESREEMTTTWNGIAHLENSNVTSFGPDQRVVIAAAGTKTPNKQTQQRKAKEET